MSLENVYVLDRVLRSLILALCPDVVPDRLQVINDTGDSPRVCVDLTWNEDHGLMGLFIGKELQNVKVILSFLRAQQVLPHDRYICLCLKTPSGTQRFTDLNVSSNRKKGKHIPIKVDKI